MLNTSKEKQKADQDIQEAAAAAAVEQVVNSSGVSPDLASSFIQEKEFKQTSQPGRKKEVVAVEGLTKNFMVGKNKLPVLKGIDLKIKQGDFTMLVGPSGCGKSTLLHIIYGLEHPSEGRVMIKGTDIWSHTKNWRADFRNKSVGFIPQQSFWLKSLSVLENVAIPWIIGGQAYHDGLKKAAKMLELIEMSDWAKHRPYDLSGGQQQRVALARALLLNPWFIIADEPTGNLDQKSGAKLMNLIKDFNERFDITILMVTHNAKQYKYASQVVEMLDGKIVKGDYSEEKQD